MLAKSVKEIPAGPFSYEPSGGFRSIVFRDHDEVEIGSRNERPMTVTSPSWWRRSGRTAGPCRRRRRDVVPDPSGRLEFETIQQRIHPADSRVRMLAEATPAHLVAFDLLALGDDDLTGRPFAERRTALEAALSDATSPIHLTPATTDVAVARRWFSEFEGAGLDGVVAKPLEGTYQQDRRVMFKIKHARTADCVVAGYRLHKSGPDAVGSLLLGLYDDAGVLANVGVIGAFPMDRRRKLLEELQPWVTDVRRPPLDWEQEMAEARTPRSAEGSRWTRRRTSRSSRSDPSGSSRSGTTTWRGIGSGTRRQFVRWRPDREPRSCTFEQLEEPVSFDLAEILSADRSG